VEKTKKERLGIIIAKLNKLPMCSSVDLAHANIGHIFREVEKDVPVRKRMRVATIGEMTLVQGNNILYYVYCYHGHMLVIDSTGGFEIRETSQLNFSLSEEYIARNPLFKNSLPVILCKQTGILQS